MAEVTRFPSDRGRAGRADNVADDLLERLGQALPRPSKWVVGPLLVLALIQAVVVLPWLIGRDPWQLLPSTTDGHITRDGALGLVVAMAGLLTAWRPRWALPAFLLAILAVVAQAMTGLLDAAETDAGTGPSLAGELVHIPSILITCLIGLAAVPFRAFGPGGRSAGR